MEMEETTPNVASPLARRYLQLKGAQNVGPICVRKLVDHFGSVDDVFQASIQALERVDGVGRYRAEAIVQARSSDAAKIELDSAAERGLRIICFEDDDYPKSLKHIPDPPVCIYVRGELVPEDGLAVAIVGSRKCSHYGMEQAERFGALLAQAGFTVVSGLARGSDAAGHRGALQAGGRTVAVLGCGLGHMYPAEHADLATDIASSGAVISELPIDTGPDAKNFPPRNRIIIGLSLGVIVIEAGKRSGALISARLAAEYNREAFAIPGLLTNPSAYGTNALIRDGHAKLVTCLEDVLDELGEVGQLMIPEQAEGDAVCAPALDPVEKAVYDAIADEQRSLEEILDDTGLSPAQVASTMTKLQIKGLITQQPGNMFVRAIRHRR
jgi:DNA processing protein